MDDRAWCGFPSWSPGVQTEAGCVAARDTSALSLALPAQPANARV